MRALWSDRQNCSHNVSQKVQRIRRVSENRFKIKFGGEAWSGIGPEGSVSLGLPYSFSAMLDRNGFVCNFGAVTTTDAALVPVAMMDSWCSDEELSYEFRDGLQPLKFSNRNTCDFCKEMSSTHWDAVICCDSFVLPL